MRILVTGASGFLGSAAAALLDARHEVARTDSSGTGAAWPCDLRDRKAVAELVRATAPDCILHCGAVSGATLVEDVASVFDINCGGTLNIAEAASAHKVRRVVLASSITVYGRHETRAPLPESSELRADDPYGSSKIAAEALLRAYAGERFDAVALRISSVFGRGRRADCLIRRAVKAWRDEVPLMLAANGEMPRQFIHIEDASRALALAAEKACPRRFCYNITGGVYRSEEAVVSALTSLMPSLRVMRTEEPPSDWPDGDIGPLDIAAAARDLNYAPRADFDASLAEYVTELLRD